jgi:flagellar biosynthetic protein FliQ
VEPALMDIWRGAITTVATVAGPFLIACLAVGLITSLFQAATQMQENVLSLVPKIVAVGLVMAVAGPGILDVATTYAEQAFQTTVEISRNQRQ